MRGVRLGMLDLLMLFYGYFAGWLVIVQVRGYLAGRVVLRCDCTSSAWHLKCVAPQVRGTSSAWLPASAGRLWLPVNLWIVTQPSA